MASDILIKDFNVRYGLTILVHSAGGVNDPAGRRVSAQILSQLRTVPHAYGITSYWTDPAGPASQLQSMDGKSGLINVELSGDLATQETSSAAIEALVGKDVRSSDVSASVGGVIPTVSAINTQARIDLANSLAISLPVLAILLLMIFGSVVASLIPLAISGISIVGALAVLRAIAAVTPVSTFALNMATGVALALAVDYSLLLINRYREEIISGRDRTDAIIRMIQTAGRTVLFSALTLMLCLSALLIFPLYAITSVAYAGIAVVLVAAAAAIVFVPAAIAVLGPRLDALDTRKFGRHLFRRPVPPPETPIQHSLWYKAAGTVMRHPIVIVLLVTEVLVLLGVPFLGIRFGSLDDRVLPRSSTVRQVGDATRDDFQALTNEVTVVMPDRSAVTDGQLGGYAESLSRLPRVIYVVASTGEYQSGIRSGPGPRGIVMANRKAAYLLVYADGDPYASAGSQVISAIRNLPAPTRIVLGGTTPTDADMLAAIRSGLPPSLAIMVVSIFMVLFAFTGSLLLPVKAIVVGALSLTAAFGALVWVFQDGHLLGYISGSGASGFIVPQAMILIVVVAFGLSMDYEIFLLGRIREEWLASPRTAADNIDAVQLGLARVGRIISAAALLMTAVFASMIISKLAIIQMFGFGLAVAVFVDASLVRGMLVPAFMRIAGRANWWLPASVQRWHLARAWSDSREVIPPVPAEGVPVGSD